MRLFGIGFISFIILVLFGKVYMAATRPVPLPVTKTLEYFAPGVKIGEPVSSAKAKLRDMRFVSHVGFVGANAGGGQGGDYFQQIRLLLSPKWRAKSGNAAEEAPIDAVELVTTNKYALGVLSPQLGGTFMNAPHVGCIRMSTQGAYREVHYWMTRNNRGGAALINDWKETAQDVHGSPVVNLILYTGEFDGARTLRANFIARDCALLAEGT
jgi:hypothetical protein